VKSLAKKGYTVHLANVDIRPDLALERTRRRYRVEALQVPEFGSRPGGADALGGRIVAASSLMTHFDDQGRSLATAVTREVAESSSAVASHRQYTVASTDSPAVLTDVRSREQGLLVFRADVVGPAGAVPPLLGRTSDRRIVGSGPGAARPVASRLVRPGGDRDRDR
jgi:hypothetical protein